MTKKTTNVQVNVSSSSTDDSRNKTSNDDHNDPGVFLQLAGRKLKNRLGSTMNESASAGAGGGSNIPAFAKKQLEKLGWNEGEGLGKRRQGMASHIKVTKRAEGLGLGESTLDPAIAQSLNADDWWKNSVGDTLARLKGTTKSKNKKEKKKDSKKTTTKVHYTDEELFEATGGARFGMRAQRRQDAKWKRAESDISEQEEKAAKEKVEWDGLTAPKVLLSTDDKTSTKKRKSNKDAAVDESLDEKADRKRQRKEKKKQQKDELKNHSTTISEKKKSKKAKASKEQ